MDDFGAELFDEFEKPSVSSIPLLPRKNNEVQQDITEKFVVIFIFIAELIH